MRALVGARTGYLLGAVFPAVLCNFVVGQNGFLRAALFGGALILLVEGPVLAGIAPGALTYKPHLGLLVPLALLAGGHSPIFVAAGTVATAMAAATEAAFGTTRLAVLTVAGLIARRPAPACMNVALQ